MRGPPVGDALEALALVTRELQIDLARGHDADLGRLHDANWLVVPADQQQALADLRHRLAGVGLELVTQARRRRLVAAQDSLDELATEIRLPVAQLHPPLVQAQRYTRLRAR